VSGYAPVTIGADRVRVMGRTGTLRVGSGAALYLGSLIGPGVLLVPALAVRAAGPASVISWGALLLLLAPLAVTFVRACPWPAGSPSTFGPASAPRPG